MKILRPVCSGVAGIFFPIGRPEIGGTCEYASELCLKKCYALNKDYDETVNIPEGDKKEIYQFFIKKSLLTICNEVVKEMGELQAKILSWFTSGDCLNKDVKRLHEVMVLLSEVGIVQNGFTRNEHLYNKTVEDGRIKHIVLTIESKSIKDAPNIWGAETNPEGLWAIPDYKSGVVELYHGKLGSSSYGGCGMNEVKTEFEGKKIAIATNCLGCYNKKIGCFIDLPSGQ